MENERYKYKRRPGQEESHRGLKEEKRIGSFIISPYFLLIDTASISQVLNFLVFSIVEEEVEDEETEEEEEHVIDEYGWSILYFFN